MHAQRRSGKALLVSRYKRKGTRIILWTEEQEDELETLYEEFKDSDGTREGKRSGRVTPQTFEGFLFVFQIYWGTS